MTALDPKELRRLKERAQKPLAPGNEWALRDLREYLFSYADSILALAEGHAAVRDKALEEIAALLERVNADKDTSELGDRMADAFNASRDRKANMTDSLRAYCDVFVAHLRALKSGAPT